VFGVCMRFKPTFTSHNILCKRSASDRRSNTLPQPHSLGLGHVINILNYFFGYRFFECTVFFFNSLCHHPQWNSKGLHPKLTITISDHQFCLTRQKSSAINPHSFKTNTAIFETTDCSRRNTCVTTIVDVSTKTTTTSANCCCNPSLQSSISVKSITFVHYSFHFQSN